MNEGSGHELGIQLDFCAGQRLRHWAVVLGSLGQLAESRVIQPGHCGLGMQANLRDLEPLALRVGIGDSSKVFVIVRTGNSFSEYRANMVPKTECNFISLVRSLHHTRL